MCVVGRGAVGARAGVQGSGQFCSALILLHRNVCAGVERAARLRCGAWRSQLPCSRPAEGSCVRAASAQVLPVMAAAPEVQAAFAAVMLLSVSHGLLPQPKPRSDVTTGSAAKRRRRAGQPRLCAEAETETEPVAAEPESGGVRAYDGPEEKALRAVRLGFGGYPAGPYYELKQSDGPSAAFALVRKDHPVLSSWSDGEIDATVNSLKTTPAELLVNSPIGPFLLLSAISIWRDGMEPWNIPPCKEYLEFCASAPSFLGFK